MGGCCGTTPAHIKALSDAVREIPVREISDKRRRILTSERKSVEIDLDGPFLVVGERINPTGKEKITGGIKEEVWILCVPWRGRRRRMVPPS